ncbi:DJ-1/PfpI family protein [Chryseolinea sp. T2]|uniref:GlxA family transcriptional regulator n=1 Tax=Chryseolinea sp. T2 TaxID=3129255 RepID=UPI0030779AEC
MKVSAPRSTICFLILPRVHLMDLSGPVQVFYEANNLASGSYDIQFAGINVQERSEQGLALAGLTNIDQVSLQSSDFIFVPGIDFKTFVEGGLSSSITRIREWLRSHFARKVNIASVCSGSLVLAEVGILDERRCTSHWKCIDYFRQRYPRVNIVSDCLYANDGNIFTSAGMTSGIDMALSIVEQQHGPILAAKVAREMVVYLRRHETNKQETIYLDYRTHFSPGVHKVQDHILSHPSENFTLDELASVANMSTRSLTRLFRKSTGHTINEFKTAVRLELARTLQGNTDYTAEKIASLCGFESARQLRRLQSRQPG